VATGALTGAEEAVLSSLPPPSVRPLICRDSAAFRNVLNCLGKC